MINEQSQTYQGLVSSGFKQSNTPPSGFDPKTWTRVRFNKQWWYKEGATVPQQNTQKTQPSVGDINQYVGIYQTDSSPFVKGRVKNNNGNLTLDFKLPKVGDILDELVFVSNNTFKLKKGSGTVTFIPNEDGSGDISSLKFSIKLGGLVNIEKTAVKVDTNPDANVPTDSTNQTKPEPTNTTTKPTQTVDPSVFNCIKNSGGNGKNLQQTVDNPNAYSFVDKTGEEFTFWGNGDFLYIGKNNKSQGKWKCKGSNNFEVITDWGGTKYYYRSETGQWALTPNAPALEENFIKKIVTKHLRSKL